MRHRSLCLLFATLMAVAGCSNSGGGFDPSDRTGLSGDRSSLEGEVDAASGVRPDVYAALRAMYPSDTEFQAVLLVARQKQRVLRIQAEGLPVGAEHMNNMKNAMGCVIATFGGDVARAMSAFREINALTFDTPERLKAYAAYGSKMSGIVYGDDVTQPCGAVR